MTVDANSAETQGATPHRAERRCAALIAAIVMALGLGLTACGKKGDPEPPPGAEDIVYPRPYPDPQSY